jgi:hypothetical protein
MRYTFLQSAAARVERLYETSLTRPADNGPESLDVWITSCDDCGGNIIGAYPMRGSLDVSGGSPVEVHNDGVCSDCVNAHAAWGILDKALSPTKARLASCDRASLAHAYGVTPNSERAATMRRKVWHT